MPLICGGKGLNNLTLKALILGLILVVLGPQAQAYRCSANHLTWSREDVLAKPLEMYERLLLRSQSEADPTLFGIDMIRSDLEQVAGELAARLQPDHPFWKDVSPDVSPQVVTAGLRKALEHIQELQAKKIPYDQLLSFYEDLTLFLQRSYRFTASSDELGFVTTKQELQKLKARIHKKSNNEPRSFALPILGDLSEADFVRTNAVPLFYAGVTLSKKVSADGLTMGPADFLAHDYFHSEFMNTLLRSAWKKNAASGVSLLDLMHQWNAYANKMLTDETALPFFHQMHEMAQPITPQP